MTLRTGLIPLLLLALVFQIAVLRRYSYATSTFETATVAEASRPPGKDFRLSSVSWDVVHYSSAPGLAPLRDFYHRVCPGKSGLAAAVALSNELARRSSFGTPGVDCFSAHYDPATDLKSVLSGRPSYCVNRSSLIVTSLLSVGVPARLVQVPVMGHNIVGVWDKKIGGWILFDPSSGCTFSGPRLRPLSTIETQSPHWNPFSHGLHRYPGALVPRNGPSPAYLNDLMVWNRDELGEGLCLIYPEPWLYTRTGLHAARFPFRAVFVNVGPRLWSFGPLQQVLRWTAAGTLLTLVVLMAFPGVWKAVRRRR